MQALEYFSGISPEAKDSFRRNGFLCLKNFLAADQVQSLRAIYDRSRRFRKSYKNSAVQRFQPLSRFEPLRTCTEHFDVNAISAVATSLLGIETSLVKDLLGAWTSNSRLTYVLPWHRDIRDNSMGYDYRLWEEKQDDREYFLQFNLPIFDDASFWVVPGSDSRADTPQEAAAYANKPIQVPGQEKFLNPWWPKNRLYTNSYRVGEYLMNSVDPGNRRNVEENERRLATCRKYAEAMPGAVEVKVGAGDILFYRGCSWHTAIYRADVDRFTFFSNLRTRDSDHWYRTVFLPTYVKPD